MAHAATMHATPDIRSSSPSSLGRDLAAGALAGQVAGLVMAVVVMAVFALFLGKSPLFPVQVIGSIVFGDAAIQGFHLPALLAGLLVHQAGPSLAWGLVLGGAAHAVDLRRGPGLVALGVAVGLASQVVDVELVVPVVMRALHGHDLWAENVPSAWSWAAHLTFGLALACWPALVSWLEARSDRSSRGPNRDA